MTKERNCFFPDAVTYPDFFDQNLTDENRVLKVVTGQYCWAQAFYYQLLKVIFEFETEQQNPTDYRQLFLKTCKNTIQKLPDSSQDKTIPKILPILTQFMQKSRQTSQISFEDEINNNPQINEAFIRILSLILQEANYSQINVEQKIKYLGEIFQFNMFEFQRGIKFQQSDTFLYFQGEQEIYIAFLNYVAEFQEYQPDFQSKDDLVSIEGFKDKNVQERQFQHQADKKKEKQVNADQNRGSNENYEYVTTSVIPIRETVQTAINAILEKTEKKQSPVAYLFQNRFRSNSNSLQRSNPPKIENYSPASPLPQQIKSPFDKVKQPAIKETKEQSNFTINNNINQNSNMEFTLGRKTQDIYEKKFQQKQEDDFKILNKMQVKRTETIQDMNNSDYKFKSKKSDVVQHKIFDHNQQQDVFYKPVSNRIPVNQPSRQAYKKDPLDICNESQKGTFYRKFTDTRILNLLSEPYRTKVKMLKNRFIGVHSRGNRSPVYEQQF